MGRFATGVAAFALGVAAVAPARAHAQTLPVLHVRRFAIAADRTSVRAGEPFHLTMTAHVDEPVVELDNVTLPDLAGIDVSGDERRCTASARGSDCSETLTVAANVPGDRIVGPWTLDAVDGESATRYALLEQHDRRRTFSVRRRCRACGDLARRLALAAFVALAFLATARRRALDARSPARAARRTSTRTRAGRRRAVAGGAARVRCAISSKRSIANRPARGRSPCARLCANACVRARTKRSRICVARGAIADPGALAGLRAIERAAFCEDERVSVAAREAVSFLMR